MQSAENLIKEIESIKYNREHFVGCIERNNNRNKELSFTLKQWGSLKETENGAARSGSKILIEIDAIFDNKTGKVKWNYIESNMEDIAFNTVIDNLIRTNLHTKLVQVFEIDNTLKIKE